MYLKIDMKSELPLYQQIVHQIIEGIVENKLQPEEPLPSVRRLAADIGINMHTVSKAYKILQQQGYIEMHRRKGAIVSELSSELMSNPQNVKQLKEMLRPIVSWALSNEFSLVQINLVVAELLQAKNNEAGDEK